EQKELLSDPWRFAQDVHEVNFSGGAHQPMQEAWLFITFPDSFEDISSRSHKQRIRDGFRERLTNGSSGNIDKDLLEIRKSLANQYGEGFYFYRSPISSSGNGRSLLRTILSSFVKADHATDT